MSWLIGGTVPLLAFVAVALIVWAIGSRESRSFYGHRIRGIKSLLHERYQWIHIVNPQTWQPLALIVLPAPCAVALGLLLGWTIPFIIASSVIAVFAGFTWLRRREERIRKDFDEQLPLTCQRLADAVIAGLALPQSIHRVQQDAAQPTRTVLDNIYRSYSLNQPLSEAMVTEASRVGVREFWMLVEALLICDRNGGPLPSVLERMARSLQELLRLREKVLGATSGARMSMRVMLATPFFMLFVLWSVEPATVEMLFSTLRGWIVLTLVATFTFVAYRWARNIMKQYI